MRRFSLLIVCATVILPRSLAAQVAGDSTSTDFHAGQWGIEFLPGRDVTTAGVLRFATPERAWVLNGSANADWYIQPGAGAFGNDATGQSTALNVQFGPRWYQPMAAHVEGFAGWGISGSYARSHSGGTTTPSHAETWSAGAYGELGMQYLFTRHFSLGARGTLLASRYDNHTTIDVGNTASQFYHLGIGPLQFTGSIFF